MAAVARRIDIHVVRAPKNLGTVGTASRLISRAGTDGQALQELGQKGSRQTIHVTAFFSELRNAQAWARSVITQKGNECRIQSARAPADLESVPIDIQGLIHDVQPSHPYPIKSAHVARDFTFAIDASIDYTRTA
jgi:hypothetical protein